MTFLGHSEGSHGGYNIADDKFYLPSHLTHAPPPRNDMISEVDVLGGMQGTDNVGNSDNKYLYLYNLDDEPRQVEQSRIAYLLK